MNWETFVSRLFDGIQPSNICSTESDDNTGGDLKKYTPPASQEELDNIVKSRLAQAQRSWERDAAAKLDEALEQSKSKNSELAEQLTTLKQEIEDSKLSATEKERKAIERAQKAAQDRIAELEKHGADATARAEAALARLVDERKGQHLSAGLVGADVFQQALPDALDMFKKVANVELDDDGKFISATFDEATHTTPLEAAKAFLKTRPWFAKASGGAGTAAPTGGGLPGGRQMHELDISELLDLAHEKKT